MADFDLLEPPNALVNVLAEIGNEVQFEVPDALITAWLNRETQRLSTIRPFRFYQTRLLDVEIEVDENDELSFELPRNFSHTDKVQIISTLNRNLAGEFASPGRLLYVNDDYLQYGTGPNGRKRLIFDPAFRKQPPGQDDTFTIDFYYFRFADHVVDDKDLLDFPASQLDRVIDKTLLKCFRRMGDMDEFTALTREQRGKDQDYLSFMIRDPDHRPVHIPRNIDNSIVDYEERDHSIYSSSINYYLNA